MDSKTRISVPNNIGKTLAFASLTSLGYYDWYFNNDSVKAYLASLLFGLLLVYAYEVESNTKESGDRTKAKENVKLLFIMSLIFISINSVSLFFGEIYFDLLSAFFYHVFSCVLVTAYISNATRVRDGLVYNYIPVTRVESSDSLETETEEENYDYVERLLSLNRSLFEKDNTSKKEKRRHE